MVSFFGNANVTLPYPPYFIADMHNSLLLSLNFFKVQTDFNILWNLNINLVVERSLIKKENEQTFKNDLSQSIV